MSTFGLHARLRSLLAAMRGLAHMVGSEANARIHLVAAVGVIGLGAALRLDPLEWALVVIAIALVWIAEGLNTALEHLADAVCPDHHPLIGVAKDVAAGAVLIAALAAVAIGVLVLGPRLVEVVAGWLVNTGG